jgi:integrase
LVSEKQGQAHSTANRVLELIRTILTKACNEWEWLERVPRIRTLPEPTKRVRWLTRNEAERLIAELPLHLADMTRFSLETGLRRSNVTGLQWSQVDLVRKMAWIHPDQAKARKAIPVPLSSVAVAVLRKQIGKHYANVFTYNGKTVTQVNTKAWHKALKRVGIENFRWHDLRHTWASWHIQDGTPLHVLQELGGWSTPEMVQKYAHLSSEHLSQWVDRRHPIQSSNVVGIDTVFATGNNQVAGLKA